MAARVVAMPSVATVAASAHRRVARLALRVSARMDEGAALSPPPLGAHGARAYTSTHLCSLESSTKLLAGRTTLYASTRGPLGEHARVCAQTTSLDTHLFPGLAHNWRGRGGRESGVGRAWRWEGESERESWGAVTGGGGGSHSCTYTHTHLHVNGLRRHTRRKRRWSEMARPRWTFAEVGGTVSMQR